MRSMTGFGSSRVSTAHAGFRVEASSVNKRGLEVIVFLPGDRGAPGVGPRDDASDG